MIFLSRIVQNYSCNDAMRKKDFLSPLNFPKFILKDIGHFVPAAKESLKFDFETNKGLQIF